MNYKILTLVIITLIIVLIAWYLYSMRSEQPYIIPATSSIPTPTTSGDTTGDISNSLSQTPSDTEANAELNSLEQDLESF